MIPGIIAGKAAAGSASVTSSAITSLSTTYSGSSWDLPSLSATAGQRVLVFIVGWGTTGAPTISTPVGWGTHYSAVDGSSNNQRMVCFYRDGPFTVTQTVIWNLVTQGAAMSLTLTGVNSFTVHGPEVGLGFGSSTRTLQTVASVPAGSVRIDHLMTCFYRSLSWAATVAQQNSHYRYTSGGTGGVSQGVSVKAHPALASSTGNLITMTDPDGGAPESPSNGYVIICKP